MKSSTPTCPTCGQKIRSKNQNRLNRTLAVALFDFWKFVLDKPNSHASEQYIKKIIERLEEGYNYIQIAHAICGILADPWHVKNRIFHIEFAIRSGDKLDKLMDSAELKGITESIVERRYDWFIDRRSEGKSIQQIIVEFRQQGNTQNGFNPATGSRLF
jgi:hypothetical protein